MSIMPCLKSLVLFLLLGFFTGGVKSLPNSVQKDHSSDVVSVERPSITTGGFPQGLMKPDESSGAEERMSKVTVTCSVP